ncbi:hypothetical protein TNCV_878811 [Trichonephila clavipes]|nr:hypothetical protein TNCV_878811 [Trichonephila clavipes]
MLTSELTIRWKSSTEFFREQNGHCLAGKPGHLFVRLAQRPNGSDRYCIHEIGSNLLSDRYSDRYVSDSCLLLHLYSSVVFYD